MVRVVSHPTFSHIGRHYWFGFLAGSFGFLAGSFGFLSVIGIRFGGQMSGISIARHAETRGLSGWVSWDFRRDEVNGRNIKQVVSAEHDDGGVIDRKIDDRNFAVRQRSQHAFLQRFTIMALVGLIVLFHARKDCLVDLVFLLAIRL